MVWTPRQDEETLEADLAKIRAATRMRLGIVVGIIVVGLAQTHFPSAPDADLATRARSIMMAAMPVLLIAGVAAVVVVGLAQRSIARVRAEYESKRFRVPRRRS